MKAPRSSERHWSIPLACLLLGYASGALSLCLPAIAPGAFTDGYGYECLMWSILWTAQLVEWPDLSFADGLMILAGWANIWLATGWIVLLVRSRTVRVLSTVWGYVGLGIALSLGTQLHEVHFGYWLWCAAFALTATGMLLSVWRTSREMGVSRVGGGILRS